MRILPSRSYLAGNANRLVDRQLLFARQSVAQGLTRDVGHDVVQMPTGIAGFVEGENGRVIELGGDRDFSEEAVRSEDRSQIGSNDFDGDGAVVLEVVRQVHRGHASATEFAVDSVALLKRGPNFNKLIRVHGPRMRLRRGAAKNLPSDAAVGKAESGKNGKILDFPFFNLRAY